MESLLLTTFFFWFLGGKVSDKMIKNDKVFLLQLWHHWSVNWDIYGRNPGGSLGGKWVSVTMKTNPIVHSLNFRPINFVTKGSESKFSLLDFFRPFWFPSCELLIKVLEPAIEERIECKYWGKTLLYPLFRCFKLIKFARQETKQDRTSLF